MQRLLPIKPITDRGEALQHAMDASWHRTRDKELLHEKFRDDIEDHAVFIAEHGVSHRKSALQVGAVVVALFAHHDYNPNRPLRRTGILLFEGYNNSPFKGAPKDCAEGRALRMGDHVMAARIKNNRAALFAKPLQPWKALWAAVAANADPNTNFEINNLASTTLDPCATPCQRLLEDHPATTSDMFIDTYSYDRNRRIVAANSYTLAQLHARYNGIAPPTVTRELLQGK